MTAPLLVAGHAADRTGPSTYLLHLLRWLRAHRPDVDVDVVLLSGGPLLEELRALAPVAVFPPLAPTVPAPERRLMDDGVLDEPTWWREQRARALQDLVRPYADHRAVYVTCAPAIELVRALPPGRRAVLSHVHELEIGLEHRLAPEDRDALLHGSTRLLSVASAVTALLVGRYGVDPATIEVHREVVDVEPAVEAAGRVERSVARRERGLPPNGPVVGACGTIEYRKGTDLFLRLAWQLRRAGPGTATFVWVGGDDEAVARARERAEALGVDDVVRFVGPQSDPASWFALMDVLVVPSREDTYPLVCIEAAAAGTPAVAFDTGGIPELLREGCGEVVPYPDVEAMAASVQGLLDDPARRRAMGERGRELVRERHDVGVVAPGLWSSIERWL